jgi:RES domain-containing protein
VPTIYPPDLLDALQQVPVNAFDGTIYRHMFAGISPFTENTRGARWNPPDTAAIYSSLTRETALAEAEWRISVEPIRPRARRTLYTIALELAGLVGLTASEHLEAVGVTAVELASDDPSACQLVGGAVAWLGHDGLLVPSARYEGVNLVIYPGAHDPDARFEIVSEEEIDQD